MGEVRYIPFYAIMKGIDEESQQFVHLPIFKPITHLIRDEYIQRRDFRVRVFARSMKRSVE